jgi:hypothetical protein
VQPDVEDLSSQGSPYIVCSSLGLHHAALFACALLWCSPASIVCFKLIVAAIYYLLCQCVQCGRLRQQLLALC